jgi:hypothetical protein
MFSEHVEKTSKFRHSRFDLKLGVLEEKPVGREKLFIHPKLMRLLTREPNNFAPYS